MYQCRGHMTLTALNGHVWVLVLSDEKWVEGVAKWDISTSNTTILLLLCMFGLVSPSLY